MLLFTPIPTGEPISTALLTVVTTVFGSVFRMFRGGVPKEIKAGMEELRNGLAHVADALQRFAWGIARALGWFLRAMQNAWVRIIRPMLSMLWKLAGRLRRLIERDLPRLIRWIDKIRQRVLEIYERYTRPILVQLQRIRRMLLILRLFRVKWAEELDRKLVWTQDKLLAPIRIALEHLALVEQWLNVIVSAEQLIQETIFHNTLYHYQDPLMRSWMGAVGRPMDPLRRKELYPSRAAVLPEDSWAGLTTFLRTGGGPLAGDISKAVGQLKG